MGTTVEQRLEAKFVKWCKERGMEPMKGPVGLSKGFPDRFVQLSNLGGTIYVEFKGTSYYGLSPMQVWWKEYIMASSPNRYFIIDTDADLEKLFKRVEQFMTIGAALHTYESQLLTRLDLGDLHSE